MNCTRFKSTIFFVLLFAASVLLQSTPASAVFIDFETYPSGVSTSDLDPVDTQFSLWGISHMTSLQYTGGFNVVSPVIGQYIAPWLNYPSGISALAPWPGDDTYYGTAQAPIQIYFSLPLNYFSISAMDIGYNGLMVEAFSADSSLISTSTIDGTGRWHNGIPGGNGLDFIEFTDYGISSVRFSQIQSPDWDRANGLGLEGYLLDDMNFTVVPEPASSVLFITGGVALAINRFRKRMSQSKRDIRG